MPTLEWNKITWNGTYDWSKAGEEWSDAWGGSFMQWYGTILPRIRALLPADAILEIAPGFGRWTQFLKDFCARLSVVDISERCIKACQERFVSCPHISYFVNDGKSLEMIPDNSIDFIFSFDSLVHAEDKVISAYVSQFARKLKRNGAAFVHHSNLGEYSSYLKMRGVLARLGVVDEAISQARAPSMTARKMQIYAEGNGLQCIAQEIVPWRSGRVLIDCMSTIVQKGSIWSRGNKVFRNVSFMEEAKRLASLSRLYGVRLGG